MYNISNHTAQINGWISLTLEDIGLSDSLYDLGYYCDVIEHQFYLGDDVLHPDVILTSTERNHSVVTECKSRRIDQGQMDRYKGLDDVPEALVSRGVVSGIDSNDLTIDIVVSSLTDLTDVRDQLPDDFVIVQFEHAPYSGYVIRVKNDDGFSDDELDQKFPINSDPGEYLPTEFYPFDIYEEDREAMVSAVLQSVIHFSITEGNFTSKDIMRDAHLFWDQMGDKKQTELIKLCDEIIKRLSYEGMNEYIEKVAESEENEWRGLSKSIQAIQNRSDEFVRRTVEKLETRQSELGEFDD